MPSAASTIRASSRQGPSPLDDLPALIARTNIHFQTLVESTLVDLRLGDVLRPGMAPVLFALYEQDDCIIKDLAARTHRSAAALNSLLGRLQTAGLVALRPCPQDGRAVRVSLTNQGRGLEPRVRQLHQRVVAAVERTLTSRQAARMSVLLRRVIAGLERDESSSS